MGKKKPVEIRQKLNDQAVEALLDMFGEPPEAPGMPTPSTQEWLTACVRGQLDRYIEKSRQRRNKTMVKLTEGLTSEDYRAKANAASDVHNETHRRKRTAGRAQAAEERKAAAVARSEKLGMETEGPSVAVKTVARPTAVTPSSVVVTPSLAASAPSPTELPPEPPTEPPPESTPIAPTTSKSRPQKPSFGG